MSTKIRDQRPLHEQNNRQSDCKASYPILHSTILGNLNKTFRVEMSPIPKRLRKPNIIGQMKTLKRKFEKPMCSSTQNIDLSRFNCSAAVDENGCDPEYISLLANEIHTDNKVGKDSSLEKEIENIISKQKVADKKLMTLQAKQTNDHTEQNNENEGTCLQSQQDLYSNCSIPVKIVDDLLRTSIENEKTDRINVVISKKDNIVNRKNIKSKRILLNGGDENVKQLRNMTSMKLNSDLKNVTYVRTKRSHVKFKCKLSKTSVVYKKHNSAEENSSLLQTNCSLEIIEPNSQKIISTDAKKVSFYVLQGRGKILNGLSCPLNFNNSSVITIDQGKSLCFINNSLTDLMLLIYDYPTGVDN